MAKNTSGMVLYRGVEIGRELASSIRYMDQVEEYRESLQALQAVWDTLALLGHLSGTHIAIGDVRSAFSGLTTRLLNSLGSELRRKAVLDLQAKAQVAIDIMVRNLFERTADIGFLATDSDLRAFADATSQQRAEQHPALLARFREYQRKYSVYSDIILLSPNGQVLAQLEGDDSLEVSRDPLIEDCLATSAAYVETFRHSDLQPRAAKSLIYSCRVTSNDGQRIVGVLCLCFRFDDECRRIFEGLIKRTDWCVITLIDQHGHVVASSDVHQASIGARISDGVDQTTQVVRFGGRPFLSTVCKTSGYQGYMGPGWSGHAMLPLEFAFSAEDETVVAQELSNSERARIMNSALLFSDSLRDIPRSAGRIQGELNRAVWNGNVALARAGGANSTFSKTLLREIGHTGMRTRDVFSDAIGNMNQTVVSRALRDCRTKAALAIDIMDRNLYERANDCRWWALTTVFRLTLAQAERRIEPSSQAQVHITSILETINRLYTVYTNLIVFDTTGTIVATSNRAYRDRVGKRLDQHWVRETLALPTTESYCVSRFEPSDLYEGRHTYVYCAAIRDMSRTSRVAGGIAIVFDAEPQFTAMLNESLPRDESGDIKSGAFGVFVDGHGQVLASTRRETTIGTRLPFVGLEAGLGRDARAHAEASWERVLSFEGGLYAVGACRSTGYREYKAEHDPYRNDVTCLVLVPLALALSGEATESTRALTSARPERKAAAARTAAGGDVLDLASFSVSGKWYAVQAAQVTLAIRPDLIATMPGAPKQIRGCVLVNDGVLLVVDLPHLLGGQKPASSDATSQFIVIMREGPDAPPFGLLVDELGDTFEIARSRVVPTLLAQSEHSLVSHVVTPDPQTPDDTILLVLAVDRLAACGRGVRPEQLLAAHAERVSQPRA